MSMIHDSIIFAAEAHNGQFRKGTKLPYIIHPMEVAQILSSVQASQEVVAAGILHDTLEDTKVSYHDLTCRFGNVVASLVLECSNLCDGSWRARKQHTVTTLARTQDENVALILCADKLSNLRSIIYDAEIDKNSIWERFSAPKEDVLWYYAQLERAVINKPALPPLLVREYVALHQKLQKILQVE